MTERSLRKFVRRVCPFKNRPGWTWYRSGHFWWTSQADELDRATLPTRIYDRIDGWFEQQSGCKRFWMQREAVRSLIRTARGA